MQAEQFCTERSVPSCICALPLILRTRNRLGLDFNLLSSTSRVLAIVLSGALSSSLDTEREVDTTVRLSSDSFQIPFTSGRFLNCLSFASTSFSLASAANSVRVFLSLTISDIFKEGTGVQRKEKPIDYLHDPSILCGE